jgi:hypothetical protein
MLREDVELVRTIVKEEIAAALATIKPTAKVAVKVETPEPAVEETKAEASYKKGK